MNYFNLINAVLTQLDMPTVENFNDAKLQIHTKIKNYINRANFEIITFEDWNFKTKYVTTIANKSVQNYATDIYKKNKGKLRSETDRSIIPEPYGSELIVYWVCMEMCQNGSNPKYNYWKQKYNKIYAELRVFEQQKDGKPQFNLKRG